MQFELSLAGHEAVSTRRMTTLHLMLAFVLCGLGAGCLVLYWFTAISPKFKAAYSPFAIFGICSLLAGLAIAAVSVFYKNWLLKGRRSFMLRVLEVLLIGGAAAVFFIAGQNIPAGVFGIAAALIALSALWERRAPSGRRVTIDASGISLPGGAIAKLLRWSEIESVLLRHNILTIELTGNRLIQRNILMENVHPEDLEAFSAGMVRQHEKERVADW
jgi:hypothetical protein